MKFLCRNCKAKYQIADEKVAGRTLRMTCQQCGEPIVVRGPAKQTGQVRQAAATGQSPAFVPQAAGAKTAAGLATDLARHAPARPEPAQPQEEWHVAINDAPVGPLRRDEVARRITQGVINRESLAWREGMDDWMQIKHIAELSALFSPVAVVPAPIAQFAPPPAAAAVPLVATPATRSDMAPIGGRNVVPVEETYEPHAHTEQAAEPASEPPQAEPEEEEVAVATMAAPVPAPVVAQAPAAGGRQAPGWAQMFALVSGGAFILAAGALLGVRVLAPNNAAPPAVATAPVAAPAAPATPPPAAPAAAPTPEQQAEDTGGSVIELDMQAIDGRSGGGKKSGSAASSSNGSDDKKKPAANNNALTAEQRAMLERMGGGLDQGPSNLRAPSEAAKSGGTQGSGQLTAEQLSAVVLKGRTTLTRCYETALRGAASQDTVRLDVDIQVSPNGNVTSVKTSGKGLPGMDECITRSVKMWRFPRSAETTQTRFPVVFQPGT